MIEAAARGREPTYALTDDWLAPAGPLPDRETALAELARRHARAHPPAGPEDLAAWSGLPMRDARAAFAAIAPELEEVEVLGRRAWIPRGLEPAPPEVRLLPAFDGILLGHRDRALTVRPEHARAVLPGGGILRPTVLAGGLVEGTWRFQRGTPGGHAVRPAGARCGRRDRRTWCASARGLVRRPGRPHGRAGAVEVRVGLAGGVGGLGDRHAVLRGQRVDECTRPSCPGERAPVMKIAHGSSPAPTMMCAVPGGQWK